MPQVCFKPVTWYIEIHHVDIFSVWCHHFFVLRNVQSQHVYPQRESLPLFYHLKKHSEFVLIIFYLQLINYSHANICRQTKSMVSFSLQDKHPYRKNVHMWCFSVNHVIGLKQTCDIKNVTLKTGKISVGVEVYWEG